MLEGITILDLTTLLPGPYATARLEAMGASVWKIEPPTGDPARDTEPKQSGTGLVFSTHRGHKNITRLNLKTPDDRTQFYDMARGADVLIHGFRSGVAERLAIDYATMKPLNPRLIYCMLTGFGGTGPWSRLAGHDINYMAVSGMLSQHLDREGRPIVPTVPWADLMGGQAAVEAILGTLWERERTGTGTFLDVSMVTALRRFLRLNDTISEATGFEQGVPELTGQFVCYGLYQTQDERWIALGALEPKFWAAFCDGVGHPEWESAQYSRAASDNPIYQAVVQLFRSRPLADWVTFEQARDACLTPVFTLEEARREWAQPTQE